MVRLPMGIEVRCGWAPSGFCPSRYLPRLCSITGNGLRSSLERRLVHDLRNDVFEHLQRMPMSYFNKTKLGEHPQSDDQRCGGCAAWSSKHPVLFVVVVGADVGLSRPHVVIMTGSCSVFCLQWLPSLSELTVIFTRASALIPNEPRKVRVV